MEEKSIPVIIWSLSAAQSFRQLYEYISGSSPVNAEKVTKAIMKIIEALPANPEKHPPDKLKEK